MPCAPSTGCASSSCATGCGARRGGRAARPGGAGARHSAFRIPRRSGRWTRSLLAATTARGRWKALDPEVATLATVEPWVRPVGWLRCFRGIDTLTAATLLLEVFDFRRFGTPRPFMSFVGLVPREASSGVRPRRGSITKTGNAHLRRVLVEAAWHSQHRPGPSGLIRARRAGQPPTVVAVAEQAEVRLHRRFARLVARGKLRTVAATAVARELCGFLWAAILAAPA